MPRTFLFSLTLLFLLCAGHGAFAQAFGVAETKLGPLLNGGSRVEGSVQLLTGSSFNLNGGAVITGDMLVPGIPTVTVNGNPILPG